jgi:hypothetical protein
MRREIVNLAPFYSMAFLVIDLIDFGVITLIEQIKAKMRRKNEKIYIFTLRI